MDINISNEFNKKDIKIILFIATGGSLLALLIVGIIFFKGNDPVVIKTPISSKTDVLDPDISGAYPKIIAPKVIYNLSGGITAVNKDSIQMEAKIPVIAQDGGVAYRLETKNILINEKTAFVRLDFIEAPVIDGVTKGGKIEETVIGLNELSAGNIIEVVSGENISGKSEFTAIKIRILSK